MINLEENQIRFSSHTEDTFVQMETTRDGTVKEAATALEDFEQFSPLDGADCSIDSIDSEISENHNCNITYSKQSHLNRHLMYYCPHQPGVDPIELTQRRSDLSHEDFVVSQKVVSDSTFYKINKEIDKYVNSCSDDFAKYQLCENMLKEPIAVDNFWPVLLDYRGSETLRPLHGDICYQNGYQVLGSILCDGFNLYGISSISIKKEAFVLKIKQMYRIS